MPINRLVGRNAAESGLFDFLRDRPNKLNAELGATSSGAASSRDRFKSSTSDIVSRLASRYGLSSSISEAAGPGVQRGSEDLLDRESEAMSIERRRSRVENMGKVADSLTKSLLNAGLDLESAEGVSRQFIMDEKNRQFFAGESEKDRKASLQKQDIREAYARQAYEMEQKALERQKAEQYKASLIRSLFGFAATVGTAAAVASTGGAAAPILIGGGTNLVGSGSTLMEQSGFVPRRYR